MGSPWLPGGLMELPPDPADHAGAALPELPPGAVPLHQGPGDAEEPVPIMDNGFVSGAGPAPG